MVAKIGKVTMRQEVYLRLRDWILNGILGQKERLSDKQLAETLGVSRTPVREALLRLHDEGFVAFDAGKSVRVTSVDFHSAFHMYSIIWTLEELAIGQAMGAIRSEHIEEMEAANERFMGAMKSRDRRGALQADHDFHSVYVQLTRNEELIKVISDVKVKLMRLDLYYFHKIKDAEKSYGEHKAIIEALKSGDLASAKVAIVANWKNSFNRFDM